MKRITTITQIAAVLLGGLAWAGAASAQSTWNVISTSSGGTCAQAGANSGNYGNSYNCSGSVVSGGTAAGTSVNVSAWSVDRGTGTSAAISGAGTSWANAFISNQGSSGFGAASRTEGIGITAPNHAFDNISPGTFDMMLVSFNTSVVLSQFGIGWAGTDSDMIVMRWGGAGTPVQIGAGTTTAGGSNMLNSTIGAGGWELVNAYSNVAVNSAVNTGASTTAGSSHWLIAAYNSTMASNGWTDTNDAFKLNFLKTTNYTCPGGGAQQPGGGCTPGGGGQVPVPGTLALASLAMVGIVGSRRRQALRRGVRAS